MLVTSLRDKTLDLLQNRSVKLQLKDISDATGLEVGWLSSFHTGEVKDPSVNRIQTLYEFLVKDELKI